MEAAWGIERISRLSFTMRHSFTLTGYETAFSRPCRLMPPGKALRRLEQRELRHGGKAAAMQRGRAVDAQGGKMFFVP